jgi:Protein of unknown function (DUF2490)
MYASARVRTLLASSFLALACSLAMGQSSTQTTEPQVWPEVDAHIQLRSSLRVLALAGVEQGVGYPYQQWYAAVALGRQFKPVLRPHPQNIDPDKEHYFLFGGGYEFLRTVQSGKIKHEDRITLDGTPSFLLPAKVLVRDRNWVELRWIDGKYSTTYRNMVTIERDSVFRKVRLTPYGSVEAFYEGSSHSWNEEWYTAGIEWPHKRSWMLDIYYKRENCPTCNPKDWNVAGATLNFFFATPQQAGRVGGTNERKCGDTR